MPISEELKKKISENPVSLTKEDLGGFGAEEHCELFKLAVSNKTPFAVHVFLGLLSKDELQEMIRTNDYEPFRIAASGASSLTGSLGLRGSNELLQKFVDVMPIEELKAKLRNNNEEVIRDAAENGWLDIVKYFLFTRLFTPNPERTIITAFQQAAYNGQRNAVQNLLSLSSNSELAGWIWPQSVMIRENQCLALRSAIEQGYFDISEHLFRTIFPRPDVVREAARGAAMDGQLTVLNYLISRVPEENRKAIFSNDRDVLHSAVRGGV